MITFILKGLAKKEVPLPDYKMLIKYFNKNTRTSNCNDLREISRSPIGVNCTIKVFNGKVNKLVSMGVSNTTWVVSDCPSFAVSIVEKAHTNWLALVTSFI